MALELLKAYGSESSSEEELEGVQEESPILLCATATSTDSDEIVTNEPAVKKRKLTKKEMKRISVANRRRNAHRAKLTTCQCHRNCNDLLSRDDVIAVNRAFWDLDLHGQKSWIRQQVTRREVSRRSTNRFLFCLPTSEGSQVEVCRKKFLNAIGFGEDCG